MVESKPSVSYQAFIVGMKDYSHSKDLTNLQTSHADAQNLFEFFKDELGWDKVKILTDNPSQLRDID